MRAPLRLLAVAMFFGAFTADADADSVTTVSEQATRYLVRSTQDRSEALSGGTANNITVGESADGGLQIRDPTPDSSLVAVSPCTLITIDTAVCPALPGGTNHLEVTPGGGDDVVTINLPARPAAGPVFVEVYGGHGADRIAGGEGDDVLEGDGRNGNGSPLLPITGVAGEPDVIAGRGGRDTIRGQGGTDYLNGGTIGQTTADGGNTLDGGSQFDFFDAGGTLGADHFIGGSNERSGPGSDVGPANLPNQIGTDVTGDTVSYGTRTYTTGGTAGVTADLDGTADDGAAGEADQIDADIENLEGTIRNDTLTGSGQNNELTGLLGIDALNGGSGGADRFMIRDGIADKCVRPGTDDVVDADLQDPGPDQCAPILVLTLFSFTFNSKPVDETIPYVEVGTLKRASGGRLKARVTCAAASKRKTCTGDLRLQDRKGGKTLATKRFRARRGKTATVTLKPTAAQLAALRKARAARLLAVSKGTSKKGPTTTRVQRRLG